MSFPPEIPRQLLEPTLPLANPGSWGSTLGSSGWGSHWPEHMEMGPILPVSVQTAGSPQGSAFPAQATVVSLRGPVGSQFHSPPRPFPNLSPAKVASLDTLSYVLLGTKHILVQKNVVLFSEFQLNVCNGGGGVGVGRGVDYASGMQTFFFKPWILSLE